MGRVHTGRNAGLWTLHCHRWEKERPQRTSGVYFHCSNVVLSPLILPLILLSLLVLLTLVVRVCLDVLTSFAHLVHCPLQVAHLLRYDHLPVSGPCERGAALHDRQKLLLPDLLHHGVIGDLHEVCHLPLPVLPQEFRILVLSCCTERPQTIIHEETLQDVPIVLIRVNNLEHILKKQALVIHVWTPVVLKLNRLAARRHGGCAFREDEVCELIAFSDI
mmetsp:Transcript_36050/g.100012  ORF Transcript_36050/g.100012 Transcript_36050/m.100012 type:complete len:219 (+) Transcript_36050:99-755(+)